MVEAVSGRLLSSARSDRGEVAWPSPWFLRVVAILRCALSLGLLALLGWGLSVEARTSYLQSRIFSHFAEKTRFTVRSGQSETIVFPKWGPYDERLGYASLQSFIASLKAHGFSVERQAEWSTPLTRFVDQGGYAVYGEKPRAGLKLFDREQNLLYQAVYPERAYPDFASIPQVLVGSLLFVEDRDLLDPENPRRNPTVEWGRFMLAVAGRIAGLFDHRLREGGASTLATQIEKFRHSPGGRTLGVIEKLRQIVSASALAYRDGIDTNPARQQIVTTYLNSEPLASRPGYGEIIGVPDALWFWYGTDLAVANRVLTAPATTRAESARKGEIYRQVLSLLLAGRRPAYYLLENRAALGKLTDTCLRNLAEAGVISIELRDAALYAQLHFRDELPPTARMSFVANKATDRLRAKLVSLLPSTGWIWR